MKKHILLALSVSTILLANETSSSQTRLQDIKVAEKAEANFDQKDISRTQSKSATELLRNEASIDLGGATANARRFYMRGISDSLMNITIDGAKQSKDLHQHRGAFANIDTDILKAVHINSGVTSAEQGAGALGGSVRFETLDAQDLLVGKNYGAFVKTTLASVDKSYKNSLALYAKALDKVGFLIYANKANSKNYKTGSGREVPASAEELKNYFIKLSVLDLNSHNLRISHEKNTQEGLYAFGSLGSDMGYLYDENRAERQRIIRKTSVLNYNFNPDNKLINTSLRLYKNDSDLVRVDRNMNFLSKTEGLDLKNIFSFVNNIFTNNLTLGVDYDKETGKGRFAKPVVVVDKNLGLYLQNRMLFNDFKVSFGLRHDRYDNDLSQRQFKGNVNSYNIAGEYFFNDNVSVFTGYANTASTKNTVPILFLSQNKQMTFNGSPKGELRLQKAQKYEAGTNLEFRNVLSKYDVLNLKFTLFNNKIKDPIARNGGGMAPRIDINNQKDIEAKGFEIKTNYLVDNFRTSLSYSHTRMKQDGKDFKGTIRRFGGSSGDKIVADFSYEFNKSLALGYSIIGVLRNSNPADDKANNKAGYTVHNLSLNYTPQEFKNLSFSLLANNLFKKDYAAHTSLINWKNAEAISEPGRDFRLSLKYKF